MKIVSVHAANTLARSMFRAADISPDRYPALSPRDTMNTASGIVAPKLGM
jgi:hypothetical protein